MLDCWYLSNPDRATDQTRLVFMEDLNSQKITYICLKGDRAFVKTINLPNDVIIMKRISANLEKFVNRHSCQDKQRMRDLIKR